MSTYIAVLRDSNVCSPETGRSLEQVAELARSAVEVADHVEAIIRDVSAYVVAPALIGFGAWALSEAESRKLGALYFCSRDGQVLKDVVTQLSAKSTAAGPKLHYLYGSRLTFRLATLTGFNDELIEWAFAPTSILTARSVLSRCLLSEGDFCEARAEERRLTGHGWDHELTVRDRVELLELIRTPRVRHLIECRLEEHRNVTTDYLRQEGLHREGEWGFVDIGWHGKLHSWVASLVRGVGGGTSTGLFIGLEKLAGQRVDLENQSAYLFDHRVTPSDMDIAELIPVLEAFCSGDHGKVVGYARSPANHISPICRSAPSVELARSICIIRKTVAAAVDAALGIMRFDELRGSSYKGAVDALVRRFVFRPSRIEARAWAAFPYDEDSAGAYARPLATPYTITDLWLTALTSTLPYRGGADWRGGSLAISKQPVRALVPLAARPRHPTR
jgi:hypothetical protein